MTNAPINLGDVLRRADRKVLGAEFARGIGNMVAANRIDADAVALYRHALTLDPERRDPAWRGATDRNREWLDQHGLSDVPAS